MNMMNRNFRTAHPHRPGVDRPTQQSPARQPPTGTPSRQRAPVNRGDDILQVIRQLSEVLTKENIALKRHRTDDVKALTERKEKVAQLYQHQMNAFHRDPQIAKSLEPSKRAVLSQAAIRLSELMGENASLLKANITVINTFLKTVVESVREKQRDRAAAYSNNGALNAYVPSKRHLAVSYNQTL